MTFHVMTRNESSNQETPRAMRDMQARMAVCHAGQRWWGRACVPKLGDRVSRGMLCGTAQVFSEIFDSPWRHAGFAPLSSRGVSALFVWIGALDFHRVDYPAREGLLRPDYL